MKLLVLGANGQVGFELVRTLSALGEVVAATRDGTGADMLADLAQPETLRPLIERVAPDWIVNAAAYTAVDKAESENALADRINGEAVGVIGEAAAAIGARVLHFSTDYVFTPSHTEPLRETEPVAPVNAYGRSKRLGETALAVATPQHLIFRTAWVYAARGHNFLRTMLRLGATRDRLTVVADQHGAPTTARWLAAASAAAIATCERSDGNRFGTYHATCAGHTTWHAFAEAIFRGAHDRGLVERVPEVVAIPSSEYPTPARRPAWSVLDGSKLETAFGIHRPDWRRALGQTLDELCR